MKKFCVVIGVTRGDLLPLLKGEEEQTDTAKISDYSRAYEDLYAMLYLLIEPPAALCVQKYEDASEISGDGQAAFKELYGNYNKVIDEAIHATMEELVNTPMEPGQNPDDYFNKKRLLHIRIAEMGEKVLDRWFKDICVTGFTDEYKDVKMTMYRDSSFDIDQIQTIMRHMFLDQQSRNGTKGRIAGRGTAMTTKTSTNHDVYCFKCKKRAGTPRGTAPNISPGPSQTEQRSGARSTGLPRTDEECYGQGATRANKKAGSEASSFRSNRTLETKGCARSTSCSSATLMVICSANPRESPTTIYLGSCTPPQLTSTSGTKDWDT